MTLWGYCLIVLCVICIVLSSLPCWLGALLTSWKCCLNAVYSPHGHELLAKFSNVLCFTDGTCQNDGYCWANTDWQPGSVGPTGEFRHTRPSLSTMMVVNTSPAHPAVASPHQPSSAPARPAPPPACQPGVPVALNLCISSCKCAEWFVFWPLVGGLWKNKGNGWLCPLDCLCHLPLCFLSPSPSLSFRHSLWSFYFPEIWWWRTNIWDPLPSLTLSHGAQT